MNRIFWRIWYAWSEHVRRSSERSSFISERWFTPKMAVMFVSFLSLINWLVIFAVIGKQKYLATRAASPGPRWWIRLSIDSQGRAQPYHLLVAFIVTAGLLAWLFGSSRGRKLTGPWRSWLLVVALAGFLGLVTELMLRF
jgi:hypothetical protein